MVTALIVVALGLLLWKIIGLLATKIGAIVAPERGKDPGLAAWRHKKKSREERPDSTHLLMRSGATQLQAIKTMGRSARSTYLPGKDGAGKRAACWERVLVAVGERVGRSPLR